MVYRVTASEKLFFFILNCSHSFGRRLLVFLSFVCQPPIKSHGFALAG
jgi:hypothetical protein